MKFFYFFQTKSDVKHVTGFDTSKFINKTDFTSLNLKKWIRKVKTVLVYLSKLSDVGKMMLSNRLFMMN